MKNSSRYFYISYLILLFGLVISTYLLFHYFSIKSGQANSTDLCSVIFGKGCSNALISNLSTFLKIPLGGWGIIYFVFLFLLIITEHLLSEYFNKELIKFAFWISAVGVTFSIYFSVYMILNPIFFCPFCAIFHILNITLFFIIKRLTQTTFIKLFRSLIFAVKYFFLGEKFYSGFQRWKYLALIIPVVVSLTLYQWIRIEGMSINLEKLAAYDPLQELEEFDSLPVHDIHIDENTPTLGPVDAPVTLVVFSDFQCPNCKMFASNFHNLIEYNKGKLKICFKFFPLNSNCNPLVKTDHYALSCSAAYAAYSSFLQGKFWEYHDSVFSKDLNQESEEIFLSIASEMNLDINRFRSDFNSESCRNKIKTDIDEGIALKLDGTPSAFLNGIQVLDLRPENLSYLVKYLSNNL